MELTLLAALIAGIVSFLSPCVLPVVPAYLGQLGVIVATAPAGLGSPTGVAAAVATPSGSLAAVPATATAPGWAAAGGWRSLPNAIAFVVGFGTVFTLFGLLLNVAINPFRQYQQEIRILSGLLLVFLGLNLMGVIRPTLLMRTWRPMDRLRGDRFGSSRPRTGIVGGLLLGATFGVGWSPCIGPTLGAILSMSANQGPGAQVALLLIAYSLGLGVPFILLALAVDRAPAITRPLVRHGRTIELVGGALVVVMGLAIMFDWLSFFYRQFSAWIPQV